MNDNPDDVSVNTLELGFRGYLDREDKIETFFFAGARDFVTDDQNEYFQGYLGRQRQ